MTYPTLTWHLGVHPSSQAHAVRGPGTVSLCGVSVTESVLDPERSPEIPACAFCVQLALTALEQVQPRRRGRPPRRKESLET